MDVHNGERMVRLRRLLLTTMIAGPGDSGAHRSGDAIPITRSEFSPIPEPWMAAHGSRVRRSRTCKDFVLDQKPAESFIYEGGFRTKASGI
jgi:hypothetical protein